LKLRRWCWYRENCLGPAKRRPCLHRLTEGRTQPATCCNSPNSRRSSFQTRTSIHLSSPMWLSSVGECRIQLACGGQNGRSRLVRLPLLFNGSCCQTPAQADTAARRMGRRAEGNAQARP
jgi:hypothetical protein